MGHDLHVAIGDSIVGESVVLQENNISPTRPIRTTKAPKHHPDRRGTNAGIQLRVQPFSDSNGDE